MPHSFDNRHYVIISADDVPNIDFSQVMETSADTLRFSVDGTLEDQVWWQPMEEMS
jgi:hypothetical protein